MKKIAFFLWALFCLYPGVPAGAALVAGVLFSLLFGNPLPVLTKRYTSNLLQVAVVGLGFGMNLLVVGKVGFEGVGYTAITIFLSLVLGLLLGKALGVARDASLLISAGTAICGGSAIAALAAAIHAESEHVSVSLVTVFLLNAAALFLFPPIGHHFGLTETQFGLWSALAVHDTSSVVGTAMQYGAQALEVGTTVKLARALWITPLTFAVGYFYSRGQGTKGGKIAKPWFILGFLLASAIVTWVPGTQAAGHWLAGASRSLLVLTLFLVGSLLTKATLKTAGFRPMLQGVLLWITAASTSLYAICEGWIHL